MQRRRSLRQQNRRALNHTKSTATASSGNELFSHTTVTSSDSNQGNSSLASTGSYQDFAVGRLLRRAPLLSKMTDSNLVFWSPKVLISSPPQISIFSHIVIGKNFLHPYSPFSLSLFLPFITHSHSSAALLTLVKVFVELALKTFECLLVMAFP